MRACGRVLHCLAESAQVLRDPLLHSLQFARALRVPVAE